LEPFKAAKDIFGITRTLCAILLITAVSCLQDAVATSPTSDPDAPVVILDMTMGIFPGTEGYLKSGIAEAQAAGAPLLVIMLDTPGGMLDTTQHIIKDLFDSPVPAVVYINPTGSTATSAGVFITLAAHVAAMAPGTSIGAAHPVMGNGTDIAKDMRTKAENMAVAMVQSIAEQRGRNVAWAKEAIKNSDSITETEALKKGVVDLVATDLDDLLRQIKGKSVKVKDRTVVLEDYSQRPRVNFAIGFKDHLLNVLANPQVLALLWVGATTGLTIELYNPGAILPGVVGVICLVLALLVSQVIPINAGAIALIVLGTLLIAAELFIPSGILGIGGIIAIILGSIYVVDVSEIPGMTINIPALVAIGAGAGMLLLALTRVTVRAQRRKATVGVAALVGVTGIALEDIANSGQVQVQGEIWKATSNTPIKKGATIRVLEYRDGLVLHVEE
jgi:membrane-bound serine protease (ClpP class)